MLNMQNLDRLACLTGSLAKYVKPYYSWMSTFDYPWTTAIPRNRLPQTIGTVIKNHRYIN
jgi:hypothetical protein